MRRMSAIAIVAGIGITGCSSSGEQAESTTSVTSIPEVETTVPVDTDSTAVSTIAGETTVASEVTETSLAPTTDTGDATTTTAAPAADPTSTSPDAGTEDDLIRFIAATEAPLEGTSLEGVVFDAAEIYIAIAQASCARFSDGDTFEQIAADLLEQLDSGNTIDDERLVGALLGAASRTICPEHADKI